MVSDTDNANPGFVLVANRDGLVLGYEQRLDPRALACGGRFGLRGSPLKHSV
jgi:hypothetical protein